MRRFGYVFDPLFLVCCGLYATNRWLIKPHCHIEFFHSWFNDVLLIPCALPPVLLAHRWLGIRPAGAMPTVGEIAAHWAGWSVLFEVIGPHIMRTTGDPWDVAAYAGGAVVAAFWWHWQGETVGKFRFPWRRIIAGWNGCWQEENSSAAARLFWARFHRRAARCWWAWGMAVF